MDLTKLLGTLTNDGMQVILYDLNTNKKIVTIDTSGYDALDDTIQAREVKQWAILNTSTLKVVLGDVIEDTQTDSSSDPSSDPSDPSGSDPSNP